jgi:hypothetical protein
MCAWIIKFLSGFAFWKADKIGKILYISIISISILFAFWKIFLQKQIVNQSKTEVKEGGVVNNYNYQDCKNSKDSLAFLGVKFWRIGIGLTVK